MFRAAIKQAGRQDPLHVMPHVPNNTIELALAVHGDIAHGVRVFNPA